MSCSDQEETADKIEDDLVKREFLAIATEQRDMYETIRSFVMLANEYPTEEGTWLGSLRANWTALRAGFIWVTRRLF